ncbi:MAG: hypothetical protein WCS89_03030 [Candidatus Paceibacterota bacterium]
MEKFPNTLSIESEANFEGNDTEILFDRLRNDKIRNQIIELLFQDEQSRVGTSVESLEEDKDGNLVFNDEGEPIVKELKPFIAQTREELEKQYDDTLKDIETVTEIRSSQAAHDLPTQEVITLGSVAPWSGKTFNTKQMSIIEAHEKGHRIRPYSATEFLKHHFHKGFDFESVPYSEAESTIFKKAIPPEDQGKSVEEIKQMFFEYLSSPEELVERMSQLKNYYGMKGEAIFTKGHLEYARNHYVSDTDMDNGMTQFFKAITPEREDAFIELINSSGI